MVINKASGLSDLYETEDRVKQSESPINLSTGRLLKSYNWSLFIFAVSTVKLKEFIYL